MIRQNAIWPGTYQPELPEECMAIARVENIQFGRPKGNRHKLIEENEQALANALFIVKKLMAKNQLITKVMTILDHMENVEYVDKE